MGVALSCALIVCIAASEAWSADQERLEDPFEITADRIDYDGARALYVATGNVKVVQINRKLTADWVAFSTETLLGVAEGDVILIDGTDELRSAFMVFDVDSLQGMLFQASVESGTEGFRIRAGELIRTGKNTFTTRDGVFTTCRCEPGERLPWQLHAAEATVELGGHGTIRNSTFNVLGVPVLWIPWAFFPVKSERETGFLMPDFQLGGRNGYGVGLPFFWAAHPQVNLTLTPRFLTERGYKQDVDLEYVFGEESGGDLFVSGLNDQYDDNTLATNRARWGVIWEHDQFLPANWRWQTDLNLTSDNFYSDDFQEFRGYRQFRFIESTSNVARDFGESGGFGVMVATRYADDVQGQSIRGITGSGPVTAFVDSDDFLIQRFAEVRADIQPNTIVAPMGLDLSFDSEAIYFSGLRNHEDIFRGEKPGDRFVPRVTNDGHFYDIGVDGTFATPYPGRPPDPRGGDGDGIFQPGEAIAERGARVVLHPRIARTFTLGRFAEFTPEIGWNQTLYKTDEQRFAERGLVTGRAELKSRLERDFVSENGGALRHIIEPKLAWAFVSQRDQDRNPLFVPKGTVSQSRLRTLSLENVTRNPSDRIEEANQIVLSVGQRFFTRRNTRGAILLQGELVTAIDWDFTSNGFGNITVEGRLFRMGPFSARLRGSFNPESVAFEEEQTEIRYNKGFTNQWIRSVNLSVAHRYLSEVPEFFETNRGSSSIGRDSEVNQLNVYASLQVTERFRLSYSTIYKLAGDADFIRNQGTVEYVSKCRCWGIGVSVFGQKRDGVGAGLTIRLVGLGDENANLFTGGFGTGVNF
jgi:lipopolysaccharide assembly outer membrane protein LptD (OstA)